MRYSFENFSLETASRQIVSNGTAIAVEPQVFDLIEFLLKNSARVVTHDELLKHVWGGRLVSESSLSARISAARGAIGDNGKDQRLIKTHAKKGFRFIGAVLQESDESSVGQFETRSPASSELASKASTPLPSIAVTPFRNSGTTELGDYFSDGIVEDIVLSLAGLGELFVISRGSTFAFRGTEVDVRNVGRQLGVRYVLGGSVLQSGMALRIWAELTDVASGNVLWKKRFDGSQGDLFAVQDEIVGDIVGQLAPQIRDAELKRTLRRAPTSYSAYDCTLRALDDFQTLRRDRFKQAEEWLKKAQQIDPTFSMAFAWDAWLKMYRMALGWSRNQENDLAEANRLADHAIHLDCRSARALATYGHLRSLFHREYQLGAEYLARAVSACPNDPLALALSSATNSYSGKPKEAILLAEQAVRRTPMDRYRFYYMTTLCIAHYVDRNYAEAIKWGAIAMRDNVCFTPSSRYLAASLAAAGRADEARQVAKVLLDHQSNFTLAMYQATHQPFGDRDRSKEHLEHLRLAGMPEN
jgi:adenylate cyclase